EAERAGIDISGTGSHHQPLQRCHAHRTVHAVPAVDGTDAGPVSEMDAYQLEVGKRSADFLGCPLGHVFMGGSVEPIAAKAGLSPSRGHRIGCDERRVAEVEGCVEDRHLRYVWPKA